MKLTAGHSAGATAARGREIHDEIELKLNARYADELDAIIVELESTSDMIRDIADEPSRIKELRRSRDWRVDEIKDLHRHVADLRGRIGSY
jgi:hypothetical protein